MNIKQSYELFRTASRPYGFEILNFLYDNPKRFTDLKKVCPNDKTLTVRLSEMTHARLIGKKIIKVNKRDFIHYFLTEAGVTIIQSVQDQKVLYQVLMEEKKG